MYINLVLGDERNNFICRMASTGPIVTFYFNFNVTFRKGIP